MARHDARAFLARFPRGAVIDEVQASPKPIILFIDEAHTLIGAGGAAGTGDAANLLKRLDAEARESASDKAKQYITEAIQRSGHIIGFLSDSAQYCMRSGCMSRRALASHSGFISRTNGRISSA